MKNLFKLLGIVAFVAIVGFIKVSCSTNSTAVASADSVPLVLTDSADSRMTGQEMNEWTTAAKESGAEVIQIGTATQEMQSTGLTAASPSFPIGSKARIKNIRNGKEVVVTITGRITPKPTRVIDVSPETARALDLGSGGDRVLIAWPLRE